jgi:hypothetical protein
MYLMFKGGMLYRRNFSAERIENLSRRRYLQPRCKQRMCIERACIRPGLRVLTEILYRYNFLVKELELGTA